MAGCEGPTGSEICPPNAGQGTTSGKPQITRTPGHDIASVDLAAKHQAEARAAGREVVKTTFNKELTNATSGEIQGRERLDSIVESVDQAGNKTYALGEVVSPSQTMASQEAKLADVAGRTSSGVNIKTEARKFIKGSGKLLGPVGAVLGGGAIAYDLATDPEYQRDEAFADFFGIASAQ